MSDNADKVTKRPVAAPDLVRHYRPIAIRSVVAAHAMIPRRREQPSGALADSGLALPGGFHSIPED